MVLMNINTAEPKAHDYAGEIIALLTGVTEGFIKAAKLFKEAYDAEPSILDSWPKKYPSLHRPLLNNLLRVATGDLLPDFLLQPYRPGVIAAGRCTPDVQAQLINHPFVSVVRDDGAVTVSLVSLSAAEKRQVFAEDPATGINSIRSTEEQAAWRGIPKTKAKGERSKTDRDRKPPGMSPTELAEFMSKSSAKFCTAFADALSTLDRDRCVLLATRLFSASSTKAAAA